MPATTTATQPTTPARGPGRPRARPRAADEARPIKPRELAVYTYIYHSARDRGYQPSFREIMEQFGWKAQNSVLGIMLGLEASGYIGRNVGHTRSVTFRLRPDGRPFRGFQDKD